ncbi:MAG: sigma-70 family polymerase sigma factor [Bacteroidetes bacterium]|nr:sigma-70 family polymerase sigma factor [Bacteroidota bacterium]
MSPSLFFLNEDARILDQIKKGDEEALVRLYQTNERQVSAFVTRNNGTRDDAEDMLQEALVILWERVRVGRYEHTAKISTFVYATVKNMWLRRLARARREVVTDMRNNDTLSDNLTALDEIIETEEAAIVSSALNKLGDPCRKLLLLYYWEELPMDEIAEQMGFANSDTVKSKKYQCKKALGNLLKGLQ